MQQDEEASSIVRSHVTKEELAMGSSTVGERLPYNDYTTIDWLHDLVRPFLQLLAKTRPLNVFYRSRILTGIATSMLGKVFVTRP